VSSAEGVRYYELIQILLPPLLEHFPDPVFVLDPEGRIAAANRAAETLSGRSRKDLLSLRARDLFSAQSHALFLAHLQSFPSNFTLEIEFVQACGAMLPVEIHAAADDAGRVEFTAREITARKRFEEAFRNSETRFRLMAKNLTEMVLAYDMNRRLTFVNAAAQTLTGYSAEDLERAKFINWVHPDDRDRMLGYWDSLFDGKSFADEEYRLITKDGRVKWVAASWGPIRDDSGRQVGVQGREREVTDRRMAEETLRQSEQRHRLNEERYRTLFEDSPFPMWEEDFSRVKEFLARLKAEGVTNLRGYLTAHRPAALECLRRVRVLDVNRAAREFYGAATKEELLGSLDKFFDEAAWEPFCEEIAVLDATNSLFKTEFQARTIRGEQRTVSMIVSVAAAPEDWSRVIVSFFDITDRKRLEEQLLQSQKLESLGRLAGGIAHDFNNLLMVVLGYSELLLAGGEDPGALERGLKEIKMAGERGAELTGQLLAFSRKQVGQPRPINLNSLIGESQSMLERVIGEDIALSVSLAPDAWNIRADRGQLHQVLMNLVINAREAMPAGGTLSISTFNSESAGGASERPDAAGDYMLLEVRDTGVGMDERTRQRVFEPFFTTKLPGKGTGLGMATVFGVVTQAGGHIFLESEPGQGTAFRLYFPRHAGPVPAEPAVQAAARAARAATGRVLVVEDQREVRVVTCAILRNLGFDVMEADSGEMALEISETCADKIDLLLTDVIMPGMNGRELAEQFAARRPRTKVIFMSGYTDRIMSEDGLLDPAVNFLQKPFNPGELGTIVGKVLQAA
jgi:two-component system cell cycle sensor histidine kinase/response regulator CckA